MGYRGSRPSCRIGKAEDCTDCFKRDRATISTANSSSSSNYARSHDATA